MFYTKNIQIGLDIEEKEIGESSGNNVTFDYSNMEEDY